MELQGKRIAFLGDSITEGSGVMDKSNRYDNRLLKMCGLAEVFNYGIGGTRLAHQRCPSEKPRYDLCFSGRAYNIDKRADVIVVFGGTNDYGHGDAPFGTYADETPATFCGAVRFLMKLLRTEYPTATVVFLAPARRDLDEGISPKRAGDPEAKPLIFYVDAIKEIAEDFAIPVLDLYRELGVNPNSAEEREKYARDGLHLTDAAHALVAEKLKALLEAI